MRKRLVIGVAVVVVAIGAGFAIKAGKGSTAVPAGAAMAESPVATQAKEQLEPYRKLPTFQAPGEAFDAAAP